MRKRFNTTLVLSRRCGQSITHGGVVRVRRSRKLRFQGTRKEKPGGGNAGLDFFVIGVYGFKYAAWLLLVAPESAERLVVIFQPFSVLVLLLSCSSLTFSNLTEPFAISHRFLFVCALTRPWVGTPSIKQYTCHTNKNFSIQLVTDAV
jgi:hypothetical protein